MNLLSATLTISEDEPALALRETNRRRPDSKGRNRYQIIYVVRDGKPVEWIWDMGPETNFTADQFHFFGGEPTPDGGFIIWENVGRLREMADHVRQFGWESDNVYGKDNTTDLVSAAVDEMDMRNRNALKRSTFGYKHEIVRT